MMSNYEFTQLQKEAIKWNDGPVIVLAGPGSGKTAVLTERIARILKETSNDTFRILALTFTNKAASEMAERITDKVGDSISRVFIGTFHSFCADVLRNHGTYVGIKTDYEIYSSEDDLNSIVEDLKSEFYKEYPGSNVENLKILKAIQYFERNLCLTNNDVDRVMPNTSYENELKWFYFKYLDKLLTLNVMDFDSLILYTYKLFTTKSNIARMYRSIYRYINIDEFQDTNNGQYMLISSLVGNSNPNLFVVADDDQVIYGWNGASYRRINDFKQEYKADLIQLNQNFRCPSYVVLMANNLITHNSGRTSDKKPLESMKNISENYSHVFCNAFHEDNEEFEFVAQLITKIKDKYPDESICVIARNNRLLDKFFSKAKENGIECEKSKRKDEFENIHVLWIYLMLKLANRRTDEKILDQLVSIMSSEKVKLDFNQLVVESQLNNGDLLKTLVGHIQDTISDDSFYKSILLDLCEGKNFLNFIESAFIWCEGRIKTIYTEENVDQILQDFYAEKNAWIDFQNSLGYKYDLDEIPISTYMQEFAMVSKDAEPKKEAVQFLTIHASKGKEFDNVILVGMVEDELPSFQSIKRGDYSPEMEEERRNCFVAITRTMKRLFITYSEIYYGWPKKPSRFINEMFGKNIARDLMLRL